MNRDVPALRSYHRQAVSLPRCDNRAWVCEEHPEKPWAARRVPGLANCARARLAAPSNQQLDRQRAGGESIRWTRASSR